jgi:hypothetical protein
LEEIRLKADATGDFSHYPKMAALQRFSQIQAARRPIGRPQAKGLHTAARK